ncbi:MAG TPA: hypothetical protein VLA89_15185 [Gemmatimonadales bacterium]|nr:hypothetical protein [Gemmatimonadales bacterium]
MPLVERIATFDNDGTLWCEPPIQVQGFCLVKQCTYRPQMPGIAQELSLLLSEYASGTKP